MRALSVSLASFFLVVCSLAALLMVFSAWFPYENMSAAELGQDDWLAWAAPFLLGFAVATLAAVVKRRPVLATASFAGVAVLGFVVLRFALIEISDNSDTEVTAFALTIGVVGAAAVITSFGQRG